RDGENGLVGMVQVCGSGDAVLGGKLQRVDNPQYLVEVAARGHRIDENELDLLVRADDEHVAHRLVVGGRTALRSARRGGWQHAVEFGDFQVGVAHHRIVGGEADDVFDVV